MDRPCMHNQYTVPTVMPLPRRTPAEACSEHSCVIRRFSLMHLPHSLSNSSLTTGDSSLTTSPRRLPSAPEEWLLALISSPCAAGQAVACRLHCQAVACHLHCQALQCRHLQNPRPAVSGCWVCCQAAVQDATQVLASSWLPLPLAVACKQMVSEEVCWCPS